MQRIRPAVARLQEEIGLEHALASRRVYTDGAEVIFDYAERNEEAMLTVVQTGQRGGARVEDLVHRFQAGDLLSEIADDFGVPQVEVEDVVRVALRIAA